MPKTNVWVKQGDNLSPSLFKIFVNDLPSYLSNTSDPVNVNGKDVHCLMYADDIILLSKSAKGLQENLDIHVLNTYCKDWCFTVNTSKTKMHFIVNGLNMPQISLPYNKIGLTVWSNTCMLVLIFGLRDSRSFYLL
jgi:hypothetical protein